MIDSGQLSSIFDLSMPSDSMPSDQVFYLYDTSIKQASNADKENAVG